MSKFNKDAWENSEKELSNEAKKILGLNETKYKKYSPSYSFALPELDFKVNKGLLKVKIFMFSYLLIALLIILILLSTLFIMPFNVKNSVAESFLNHGKYISFSLWNNIAFLPATGTQEKTFIFGLTPFFIFCLIIITMLIATGVIFLLIKRKYAFDDTCYFLYSIFVRINIFLYLSILVLFFLQSSTPYAELNKEINIISIKSIFFTAEISDKLGLISFSISGLGIGLYSSAFVIVILGFLGLILKYIYDIKKVFKQFKEANIIDISPGSDLYEI